MPRRPPNSPRLGPQGRPTDYKPEYCEQAHKLSLMGATDIQIADFFEISTATLFYWKQANPDFASAIKVGKSELDDMVERSLYHRATGYSYDAVKILPPRGKSTEPLIVKYREHCPPDTVACIFWLKNRRKDMWRDVHKLEHGGVGDFDRMTDDELRNLVAGGAIETGASGKGTANPPGTIKAREPGRLN